MAGPGCLLLALNEHLLQRCLGLLPVRDLLRSACVCKALSDTIGTDSFWRCLFLAKWDAPAPPLLRQRSWRQLYVARELLLDGLQLSRASHQASQAAVPWRELAAALLLSESLGTTLGTLRAAAAWPALHQVLVTEINSSFMAAANQALGLGQQLSTAAGGIPAHLLAAVEALEALVWRAPAEFAKLQEARTFAALTRVLESTMALNVTSLPDFEGTDELWVAAGRLLAPIYLAEAHLGVYLAPPALAWRLPRQLLGTAAAGGLAAATRALAGAWRGCRFSLPAASRDAPAQPRRIAMQLHLNVDDAGSITGCGTDEEAGEVKVHGHTFLCNQTGGGEQGGDATEAGSEAGAFAYSTTIAGICLTVLARQPGGQPGEPAAGEGGLDERRQRHLRLRLRGAVTPLGLSGSCTSSTAPPAGLHALVVYGQPLLANSRRSKLGAWLLARQAEAEQ